jgi:hypothetical protein
MFQFGDFSDVEMQKGTCLMQLSLIAAAEDNVPFKQHYCINVY